MPGQRFRNDESAIVRSRQAIPSGCGWVWLAVIWCNHTSTTPERQNREGSVKPPLSFQSYGVFTNGQTSRCSFNGSVAQQKSMSELSIWQVRIRCLCHTNHSLSTEPASSSWIATAPRFTLAISSHCRGLSSNPNATPGIATTLTVASIVALTSFACCRVEPQPTATINAFLSSHFPLPAKTCSQP